MLETALDNDRNDQGVTHDLEDAGFVVSDTFSHFIKVPAMLGPTITFQTATTFQ